MEKKSEAYLKGFEEGYLDGYHGREPREEWYFLLPLFPPLYDIASEEFENYRKGYKEGYAIGAKERKSLLE